MLSILSITLPIFLLVGLGWFAVRRGLFTKVETRAMGRLVLNFALPAVLFRALAERPLSEVLSSRYLLAYGLGSLAMYGIGFALFRLRGRSVRGAAILSLGVSSSNSAFIGLPIVTQFLGHAATAAVAQTLMIETLLMVPLGLALAETGVSSSTKLLDILRGSLMTLVRNPMIIAILLGALVSVLGLSVPAPVGRAIELLAGASTPVALFVIGGALVGLEVHGLIGSVAAISIGKLVFHPLAVTAAVLLVGVPDPVLATAATVLAASPMLSILPLLGHRHDVEDVGAATLVTATVSSFVTISTWLWLLR